MKKVFAFILLICHMNTSMFLPQVAEDDQYDANGKEIDDINSVYEYVDQVVLGNYDDTPEDEDSDNGQNFHLVKTPDYHFEQSFFEIANDHFTEIKDKAFAEYKLPSLTFVSYDILTPPPDKV